MDILTDFPERLRRGKVVFIGDERRKLVFRSVRQHPHGLLVSFKEFGSAEAVGELRNQLVYIQAAGLPKLPEGEYYHHQLLGMAVIDEQGNRLGTLESILETGANDVYVVRSPEGNEILLPAIEDVILDVDVDHGELRVRQQEYY